jgi:solute carrier family 25 carnitine/acylcarnitine transporter 20/29
MLFDNYYIKGSIAGMSGILLSHPVDSIKTSIQTNNKMIFNFKNLYRGIMSPLIGVGIEKAIVFGTYNYCKNNNINIPISGALSGLAASMIVSPYERIKIMKQTNQKIFSKHNPWLILSPSFLFKGLSATFTREVPGFAIYFSTYEYLKNYFYTKNNKNISIISSFIFGGISGSMAWIFIYPQDRIKTIIQSNNTNINIKTIIKNIYNSGGLKQFYNGFSFAVARAILLHSGTFCTMEILNLPLN